MNLSNPPGVDDETQRASLDSLRRLNEMALGTHGDLQTTARIQSYEMAYRLQSSAPELTDLSQERLIRSAPVFLTGYPSDLRFKVATTHNIAQ